jgi:xanthine dehydrogenase accessory factor
MFENKEFLEFIKKSSYSSLDIVLASVIHTEGATYAKPGNMIIVNSQGNFVGVLGSTTLHNTILELSKNVLLTKTPYIFTNKPKDIHSGHGTSKYLIQAFFSKDNYDALGVCLESNTKTLVRSIDNNGYEIIDTSLETKLNKNKFYQTIKLPYSVLIFGSGAHVKSFISMANIMGWKTTVLDLRPKVQYIQDADEIIHLKSIKNISTIDFNSYNASIILSHCTTTDDIYLEYLLKSTNEYIGIMGNKKNMQSKIEQFNLKDDKRFFAPIGLDIGGNTHQSIALSICSQIEARKNGKI